MPGVSFQIPERFLNLLLDCCLGRVVFEIGQLAVGSRRKKEFPLHSSPPGVFCKGTTITLPALGGFFQALLHAGKRLGIPEKPRFGNGDRFHRIQNNLAEGITVDVERVAVGNGFPQGETLFRVGLDKLGHELEILIFQDCWHAEKITEVGAKVKWDQPTFDSHLRAKIHCRVESDSFTQKGN